MKNDKLSVLFILMGILISPYALGKSPFPPPEFKCGNKICGAKQTCVNKVCVNDKKYQINLKSLENKGYPLLPDLRMENLGIESITWQQMETWSVVGGTSYPWVAKVELIYDVANRGQASAKNKDGFWNLSDVAFTVKDAKSGEIIQDGGDIYAVHNPVNVQQVIHYNQPWFIVPLDKVPPQGGKYDLCVRITGTISSSIQPLVESNYANNEACMIFTLDPKEVKKPDLVLSNAEGQALKNGAQVKIKATFDVTLLGVENMGQQIRTIIKLYDANKEFIKDICIHDFQGGIDANIPYQGQCSPLFNNLGAGSYFLRFMLDGENDIDESNEQNNAATVTLIIP